MNNKKIVFKKFTFGGRSLNIFVNKIHARWKVPKINVSVYIIFFFKKSTFFWSSHRGPIDIIFYVLYSNMICRVKCECCQRYLSVLLSSLYHSFHFIAIWMLLFYFIFLFLYFKITFTISPQPTNHPASQSVIVLRKDNMAGSFSRVRKAKVHHSSNVSLVYLRYVQLPFFFAALFFERFYNNVLLLLYFHFLHSFMGFMFAPFASVLLLLFSFSISTFTTSASICILEMLEHIFWEKC